MNWKPSKRQAQLKKRLIDSSRVYWSTSHVLDRMLLKMLHSNGVYTPDDLYNRYVSHHNVQNPKLLRKPGIKRPENGTVQINQTLKNLNQVLVQLKDVINKIASK